MSTRRGLDRARSRLFRLFSLPRLIALALWLALASGCAARTEIVVVVSTDLSWGPTERLRSLLITVREGNERGAPRDQRTVVLGDGSNGTFALPATFGIVPLDGDANRTFWVEVVGCGASPCTDATSANAIVSQRALTGFVRGRTLALNLFLSAQCEGQACDATHTCSAGACIPAQVPASSLQTFDPNQVGDAANDLGPFDATDTGDSGSSDASDAFDVGPQDAGAPQREMRISAGSDHTCAIRNGGQLWCWGSNVNGELGQGDLESRFYFMSPVQVPLSGVTSVSAGFGTTCAVHSGGQVSCWGYNGEYQVGASTSTGTIRSPTQLSISGTATEISLGVQHGCIVDNMQQMQCWGTNGNGELGDGTTDLHVAPSPVPGLSGVRHVTMGRLYTCALLEDGTVRCWGDNSGGQLGDGTMVERHVPTQVMLNATTPLSNVIDVQAGWYHTCALLADHTMRCWGFQQALGIPDTGSPSLYPVTPMGLGMVSAIVTGDYSTCAIMPDSSVKCWGANDTGQLGTGDDMNRYPPAVATRVGSGISEISMTDGHACALRMDGSIVCWGRNDSGQLGNGSTTSVRPSPVDTTSPPSGLAHLVLGLEEYPAIGAWGTDPRLFAWGAQGGTGYPWPIMGLYGTNVPRPIPIQNVMTVSDVGFGSDFACGLYTSDSTVRCWGLGTSGQYGNGTMATMENAVFQATGITNATQISTGFDDVCVLRSNHSVSCWGNNNARQLGVTTAGDMVTSPATADAFAGLVDEVRASVNWTCVRTSGGNVYCWGENLNNRLADDAQVYENNAVQIQDVVGATQISVARDHGCAIVTGGRIACWGLNDFGQSGTTTPLPGHAVTVSGLSNMARVAAGDEFTCALAGSGHPAPGSVWCWGNNSHGQLGTGRFDMPTDPAPVQVTGITDATTLVAGVHTVCALRANGTPTCWGRVPGTGLGDAMGYGIFNPVQVAGLPPL